MKVFHAAQTLTAGLVCMLFFLTAIGMGMSMSGFSFAVNSYFTTRRARAMGLAVTIMGFGPIIMPQVTSILLSFYGIQVPSYKL